MDLNLTPQIAVAVELPLYQGIAIADVVLADSPAVTAEACRVLLGHAVLGFDTEAKPTFAKGEVSTGPHLIQLASETRAFLFPISSELDLRELKEILESPTLLKVGFGLGNDRSALRARLGIEPAAYDLRLRALLENVGTLATRQLAQHLRPRACESGSGAGRGGAGLS